MNKHLFIHFMGFLLLAIFLVKDVLPVAAHCLGQDDCYTSYELVSQSEKEGSEPVRETEATEYWLNTLAGNILPHVNHLPASINGQQDTFFNQQVYLSIPTPPPDVV